MALLRRNTNRTYLYLFVCKAYATAKNVRKRNKILLGVINFIMLCPLYKIST